MLKTCCFSTSIFWGSGLDFGASWVSKSAALLAAPGVLKPTAFYACINILLFLTRGGQNSEIQAKTGVCWDHVGTFFKCQACYLHNFRSLVEQGAWIAAKNPCWHSLSALHNHLAARRYVRSTSAASRRESRACQTSCQILAKFFLPQHLSFRMLAPSYGLKIPSWSAFPPSYVPSPGPAHTAALRPQFAFEASKCDF